MNNMPDKIDLSKNELLVLQDIDFLLTKKKVFNKIFNLMEITRERLMNCVQNKRFSFPMGTETTDAKISKGENYLDLPYMVLDYPTLFSKENIFSYRTMFWWGNFFSATLHLEGISLNKYRDILANYIEQLLGQSIYISVGSSPWQYHYDQSNYVLLDKNYVDHIKNCKFLKLSKKINIKEWENVPDFSSNFFEFILTILQNFK